MCTNCAKCCVFSLCIVLAVSSEATTHNSSGNCGQEATSTVYLDVAAEAIGKAKNGSVALHDTTGKCGQKETLMSYLEVASEMINKAKLNFPTCNGNTLSQHRDIHTSCNPDCSNSTNISKDPDNSAGNGNTLPQHRDIHTSCNPDCSNSTNISKDPDNSAGNGNTLSQHRDIHTSCNPDCSNSTNISKDPDNSAGGGNVLPKQRDSHLNSTIVDCVDLLRKYIRGSGVYTISPKQKLIEKESFDVYCDTVTDGGGWTVIQRRGDFNNPVDYFFKDWNSYKEGFGDLNKEFWLGNDKIFALTNQEPYSVRFDLVDAGNQEAYAYYDQFLVDNESSKYTIQIQSYSGDAGDCMTHYHNKQKFSTRDQDNTELKDNSAKMCVGAWWFKDATKYCAHLNGENLKGWNQNKGKMWWTWKRYYSLARTEIKIRPLVFRPHERVHSP